MNKKPYLRPNISVVRVELENPICAGSVISPEKESRQTIQQQDIISASDFGADFSGQDSWTPNSTTNN